jgi:hypothetical protein
MIMHSSSSSSADAAVVVVRIASFASVYVVINTVLQTACS